MMDPERLACFHAALQAGVSWDELLRRERMTRVQWVAAERALFNALSAEASAGRFELCDRYRRALTGGGSPEPVPQAHTKPTPALALDPVAATPAAMRRFSDVEATQDASAAPPDGPVLPFVPATTATRSPDPAWMPKGMRSISDLDATQTTPNTAPRPALPFSGAGSGQAPLPPRDKPSIPAAMRGFADQERTELPSPDAARGPVLPFAPSATAPQEPPPQTTAPPEAPAWMPKGMRAFLEVDGTETLPRAPATPAPATPPAAAPPRLTLEQYARLCVELAFYPAYRDEVLRRYSIDEEQRRQAESFWCAHMNADVNVRRAWEGHCAAHQAWLRGAHDPRG